MVSVANLTVKTGGHKGTIYGPVIAQHEVNLNNDSNCHFEGMPTGLEAIHKDKSCSNEYQYQH